MIFVHINSCRLSVCGNVWCLQQALVETKVDEEFPETVDYATECGILCCVDADLDVVLLQERIEKALTSARLKISKKPSEAGTKGALFAFVTTMDPEEVRVVFAILGGVLALGGCPTRPRDKRGRKSTLRFWDTIRKNVLCEAPSCVFAVR